MPIQVKRKKDEPLQSFIYRFNRSVIQSGVLKEAKSQRFLKKKQSKNQLKKSAVYKLKMREQIKQLRRAGILKGGEDLANIKKLLRNPKRARVS